mmetsp:Transcript_13567/g.29848  ORF Transcript_13567/g.29848 Transcript_13567/m.29848 type:complete len:219 (-) Transcript_13567:321-977(-)
MGDIMLHAHELKVQVRLLARDDIQATCGAHLALAVGVHCYGHGGLHVQVIPHHFVNTHLDARVYPKTERRRGADGREEHRRDLHLGRTGPALESVFLGPVDVVITQNHIHIHPSRKFLVPFEVGIVVDNCWQNQRNVDGNDLGHLEIERCSAIREDLGAARLLALIPLNMHLRSHSDMRISQSHRDSLQPGSRDIERVVEVGLSPDEAVLAIQAIRQR